MIRAIFIFAVIAAVLVAGNWLLNHPGTVAIDLPGYVSVDWSFARGTAFLAIAIVALIVAIWLVLYILRAPWRLSGIVQRSRRERGMQAISMGMVAVAAGDTVEARAQARRAKTLVPAQPLTKLLAAQSAQLDGDNDAARDFFQQLTEEPDAAFLGVRGLWMQAMKDGRTREALGYAQQANELQPNSGWVLESMFGLQSQLGQWEDAEKTLASMIKLKSRPLAELRHDQALVQIERSKAAQASGDIQAAVAAAKKAYKLEPKFVPAANQLACAHIADGRRARAEKIIEDAWSANPHRMLAETYHSVADQVSPDKQLKLAETLAARKPNHEESRILIADFAMQAEDWGKARASLEPLTKRDLTTRLCRMMAELELVSRNDVEAARDWIAKSATALPDDAWVCKETGAVQADWTAVCRESTRFGTLEWRTPYHLPQSIIALPDQTPSAAPATPAAVPVVVEAIAEPVVGNELKKDDSPA